MATLQEKFGAVIGDLEDCLLERSTAIYLAFLALLSGEHLILVGTPGTAKSLLTRELVKRIDGVSNYFEYLLSKFTGPSEIFGAVDLLALDKGEYRRVKAGSIITSQIAFLDEIFKANSSILNSLLSILNERLYHERGNSESVPLLSVFAASNELPSEDENDEGLAALYDRFLLRYEVVEVQQDSSVDALLDMGSGREPYFKVSLDDIKLAQQEVSKVNIPQNVKDTFKVIKHKLAQEGIQISGRRIVKLSKILKVVAWLEGATEVEVDHLEVLVHILWDKREQIKVVNRVVATLVNPLSLVAQDLEDKARDIYEMQPKGKDLETADNQRIQRSLDPLILQLEHIAKELKKQIKEAGKRGDSCKKHLTQIVSWRKDLSMMSFKASDSYADLR